MKVDIIKDLRKFYPSLIANEIVGVQPMKYSLAEVFEFQNVYSKWYQNVIKWMFRVTLCKIGLHPLQTEYLCYAFHGHAIVCDCCNKELA